MGSNRSPSHLRGFLLPLDLSIDDIWSVESSYTTAEKNAGAAIPTGGNEKLVINTSGSQINDLDVRTQSAGTPGNSKASFVWKKTTGAEWFGDNSLNAITDFQFLKKESSLPLNTYRDPACLALQNGDLLFAYSSTEAVGQNGIIVKRMEADGSTFSAGSTVFNTIDHVGQVTGSNPAMCQLSDGSVILVIWANYVISSNLSNLWVYRSVDNGSSWDLVSKGALDSSIDRLVYDVGRISIGAYNGQILLISEAKKPGATRPNILLQAASTDEGMSFRLIGDIDENYYCYKPSLVVCNDGFLLTYITSLNDAASSDGKGECFLFPNAFFPFANRGSLVNPIGNMIVGTVATTPPKQFTAGSSTSWKDEENNVFVVFRNLPTDANAYGGNGGWWMMVSSDNGSTWSFAGDRNPNYIPPYIQTLNDDSEYLKNLAACSTKGKSWIFCQPETTSGSIDNSLILICLRGFSTITLPPRFQDATILQQFGYNHSYLPIVEPDVLPDWSSVNSGAPGVQITKDGLKIDTSTTSYQYYKYTFLAPDANHTETGCVIRFVARSAAGGSATLNTIAARLAISDAAHDYQVLIRFSDISILILDELAGATLATATPSPSTILTDEGVEILMAVANGRVSAWYRPNDHVDAKGWFELTVDSILTDGGGGVTNYLSIGNIFPPASGTVTSYWKEVCLSYRKGYGGQFYPNLSRGFGNPNDLTGKLYPSYGNAIQVTEGLFVSTQDGPAQLTDRFSISPSSPYGIENIFHSQNPSPQNGWRSQAITGTGAVPSEFIALQMDQNGENIQFMSDMIAIHLEGINFKDFKIEGYDAGTSSWVVLAAIISSTPLKSFRYGNRLDADPTGAAPYPYFFHDELEGWIAQIPKPGFPPVFRRVLTNSEGSWKGGAHPRPATIVLENTDATDPTSINPVSLIPRKVSVVINLNGSRFSAIGLRIDSQNTMTNDFRIGHMSVGPVHIIAPQYSHGREITYTANTEIYEQPDGTVRARNMGRGKRSFSISWNEPVDTSSLMPMSGSPAPDYYLSSNDPSAKPVASFGGVPFDILGYFRHMRGSFRPVVYFPSLKFAENASEEIRVLTRDLQHSLCMLDNDVSIDSAMGNELVEIGGEAFRISTINMVEIT